MKTSTCTRSRIGLATLMVALTSTVAGAEDTIGGGPRADFLDDTFSIPCVQVDNLGPQHEGRFYDVVLERRGNSFNFELVLAKAEDPAYCQRLADFSRFDDADFDGDDDDDDNGNAMLVSCELRPQRSRISIEARDLEAGQYFVIVESGGIQVQSQPRQTTADGLELKLDSNQVEIAKGATPLVTDYLEGDGSVYAELVNEATGTTVASAEALCAVI